MGCQASKGADKSGKAKKKKKDKKKSRAEEPQHDASNHFVGKHRKMDVPLSMEEPDGDDSTVRMSDQAHPLVPPGDDPCTPVTVDSNESAKPETAAAARAISLSAPDGRPTGFRETRTASNAALVLQKPSAKQQAAQASARRQVAWEKRRAKVIELNMTPEKHERVRGWVDGSDQGLSPQLGKLLDPEDTAGHSERLDKCRAAEVVPNFAETVRVMFRAMLERRSAAASDPLDNSGMSSQTTNDSARRFSVCTSSVAYQAASSGTMLSTAALVTMDMGSTVANTCSFDSCVGGRRVSSGGSSKSRASSKKGGAGRRAPSHTPQRNPNFAPFVPPTE
jgi:hypothetical protein